MIQSISSAPTAGGEVDIAGLNFGPAGTSAAIIIAGKSCSSPVVQSHTLVSCTITSGTGANLLLQLTVGSSTVQGYFSYAGTVVQESNYLTQ